MLLLDLKKALRRIQKRFIYKNNSKEIRILASILSVDGRCITGSNMMKMSRGTGLSLMACNRQSVRSALSQRTSHKEEEWMVSLLARLLQEIRDCI